MSTLILNPAWKGASTPREPQYIERNPGRDINMSPNGGFSHSYSIIEGDNFTDDEVIALPDANIISLTTEDIISLTPLQIALFMPNQVANLTPAQIAVMTPLQVKTFIPTQSNTNEALRKRIAQVFSAKVDMVAILKARTAAKNIIAGKGLPSALSQVGSAATAKAQAAAAARETARVATLNKITTDIAAQNRALAEKVAVAKAGAKSVTLKNLAAVEVNKAIGGKITMAESKEIAAALKYDVKDLSNSDIRAVATVVLGNKAAADAAIKNVSDVKTVKQANTNELIAAGEQIIEAKNEAAQIRKEEELNAPDSNNEKIIKLGYLDRFVNYVYKSIYG
jgi:hypothetical protein